MNGFEYVPSSIDRIGSLDTIIYHVGACIPFRDSSLTQANGRTIQLLMTPGLFETSSFCRYRRGLTIIVVNYVLSPCTRFNSVNPASSSGSINSRRGSRSLLFNLPPSQRSRVKQDPIPRPWLQIKVTRCSLTIPRREVAFDIKFHCYLEPRIRNISELLEGITSLPKNQHLTP